MIQSSLIYLSQVYFNGVCLKKKEKKSLTENGAFAHLQKAICQQCECSAV